MKIMAYRWFVIFFLYASIVAIGCDRSDTEYKPPVSPGGGIKPSISSGNEIALVRDIVAKEPDNLNAWIKLGNMAMDAKRFDEAINAYSNALRLDPSNVNVRVDLGTCYRRSGDAIKANEVYEKAIEMQPDHLHAHRNRGVVLAFDLHRYAEAAKEFETYLKLSPNAQDKQQIRDIINELKVKAGSD
jgi:cytochrome c-type biogenesis protein CcmH/NrfG